MSISDSHLFLSLNLDCYNQYKKIVDYGNIALLQNNNLDLSAKYKILFDSLMMLDSLEENILAIEKHVNFGCVDKYQERSKELILRQKDLIKILRSSLDKRINRSNAELQIKDIKFHRSYTIIFSILVITQIFLAALTVDWHENFEDLYSFRTTVINKIEVEYENFIKKFE